jgi:hypothetical protein
LEGDCYWKNGTILTREGNRGLIICDAFQRKIQVWICGPDKKSLLSIVREKIDYIHKTLNEPDVREMAKCICADCIDAKSPFFYDYDTLRSFYGKGKKTVARSHSAEDVSIEVLLGGIGDVVVNTEAELLETLRALKERYENEERVLEKANKIIQLHPSFMGVGLNLNELIRMLFTKDPEKPKTESGTDNEKEKDEQKQLGNAPGRRSRKGSWAMAQPPIRARPAGGSDPAASSKRQFCDSAHARHRAACQIVKKVFEVILKIFQALALRNVIGELFEVPEPVVAILPINIASGHVLSVKQLGPVSSTRESRRQSALCVTPRNQRNDRRTPTMRGAGRVPDDPSLPAAGS